MAAACVPTFHRLEPFPRAESGRQISAHSDSFGSGRPVGFAHCVGVDQRRLPERIPLAGDAAGGSGSRQAGIGMIQQKSRVPWGADTRQIDRSVDSVARQPERLHRNGDPIRVVLAKFPDAKKTGAGWTARCPAHDDRHASLSINVGDGGKVLLHCHAGCTTETIVAKLGLKLADLFPPRESHRGNGAARKIVAEYSYLNAAGDLLYQTVRYSPKDFRQRRPNGKGGWIWNLDGVPRVLYRLIELRESGADEWVHVCEGEKDCDRLANVGLVATCNVGGAGKWRKEYNEALRDRRVCIIVDKDKAGRDHGQQVAASLAGIAREIRVLELPGDGVKDSSDWFDAGGTADALVKLVEAAPVWTPAPMNGGGQHPKEIDHGPILVCVADVEPREIDWVWHGRIPLGRITLLVATSGCRKIFPVCGDNRASYNRIALARWKRQRSVWRRADNHCRR